MSSWIGPGVCGASTKGLEVGLSRPSEILVGDRRERQQLDLVDLDHHGTAPVDASDLDLWSRPEAVGDGDGSVRHSIAEISAELHAAIVSPGDQDVAMQSGEERFTVDDLYELSNLFATTWSSAAERDWSVRAGTLEWSCTRTADHTVDCVSRRPSSLLRGDLTATPT